MSRTPTLVALGLLTLTAAAGLVPSAQAGEYGRSGYSSGHHDRGYVRHGYRHNRGHVRTRWSGERWFRYARRGHRHGHSRH